MERYRFPDKYVSIEQELISAVFMSPRKPNPIIYLVLIKYLFGSLEQYYTYEYELGASVSLQYMDVFKETVEDRIHDISFYASNLPKWFIKEYIILGETKDDIIIKHLKCGNLYRHSKKVRLLKKCHYCIGRIVSHDCNTENIAAQNKFVYYTSTSEYGKIHGKKEKQIRNYCKANRIPGAILFRNTYLIPIDAPYPADRRFKKNRE